MRTVPSISKELDRFVHHTNALADAMPLTMQAVGESVAIAHVRHAEFLTTRAARLKEGDQTVFQIGPEIYEEFKRLSRRRQRTMIASAVVPRSFVVSLVSQYDSFLGRLIRALYQLKPELLKDSEKQMSIADLLAFKSLEEAKEHFLEKEIESVLRESHATQFKWLESKFKVPLRKDLPIWPTFIEVTERRNLFVHTDGLVSSQYLKVCAEHGALIEDATPKLAEELQVTPDYFQLAYEAIFEVGVKLASVLWRKLFPDDLDECDKALATITYELLSEEKFRLARVLLDFAAVILKKHGSEVNRRIFVINRAQAYKWLGQRSEAAKIISEEDWSATNDSFQMAAAVILDHNNRVFELMKKAGDHGTPRKGDYREWPLFRELRGNQQFQDTFRTIFAEELITVEEKKTNIQ